MVDVSTIELLSLHIPLHRDKSLPGWGRPPFTSNSTLSFQSDTEPIHCGVNISIIQSQFHNDAFYNLSSWLECSISRELAITLGMFYESSLSCSLRSLSLMMNQCVVS